MEKRNSYTAIQVKKKEYDLLQKKYAPKVRHGGYDSTGGINESVSERLFRFQGTFRFHHT